MNQIQTQSCDGYTSTTLIGNWDEDRQAKNQPQNLDREHRKVREIEQSIAIPGIHGQMKHLPRVKRLHPWVTKDVIQVNDGFKEFRSQYATQQDINNIQNFHNIKNLNTNIKYGVQKYKYTESMPFSQPVFLIQFKVQNIKSYKMLNESNFIEDAQKQRDVKQTHTEYGSTLSKHGPNHNRFYNMTQYQDDNSRQKKETTDEIIKNENFKYHLPAGIKYKKNNNEGIRITTMLMGEVFKNSNDPKENTFIQKSWLSNQDKSLQFIRQTLNQEEQDFSCKKIQQKKNTFKSTISQMFNEDIQTSLPLQDGAYFSKQNYLNNNEYRHIRSDINMIHNKPLIKK